jgi:hypothetical protein
MRLSLSSPKDEAARIHGGDKRTQREGANGEGVPSPLSKHPQLPLQIFHLIYMHSFVCYLGDWKNNCMKFKNQDKKVINSEQG